MTKSKLQIAKEYCEFQKCKFEELTGDILIISSIGERKIGNNNVRHYKYWPTIKHRAFEKCIIHPDGDIEMIGRIGPTYNPVKYTYNDILN